MATLFVRHQVSDYAKWREVYQTLSATQKQGGVVAESVYRNEDDPNDITVTHEFATLDQARAFVGSDVVKEAMGRAGVVGAPTVWFTQKS